MGLVGYQVRGFDRGVRQIDVDQFADLGVQHGHVLAAGEVVDARDATVVEERVRRAAEDPLRPAELGLHLAQRLDPPVALAVEVPPARAVAHEVQLAGGTPRRLQRRLLAQDAGHHARVGHRAVRGKIPRPDLAAVPRHPR